MMSKGLLKAILVLLSQTVETDIFWVIMID